MLTSEGRELSVACLAMEGPGYTDQWLFWSERCSQDGGLNELVISELLLQLQSGWKGMSFLSWLGAAVSTSVSKIWDKAVYFTKHQK